MSQELAAARNVRSRTAVRQLACVLLRDLQARRSAQLRKKNRATSFLWHTAYPAWRRESKPAHGHARSRRSPSCAAACEQRRRRATRSSTPRSVFGGVPGRWFWQAEMCLKTTTGTAELMARCYVGALGSRGTCYSREGSVGKEEQKHGEGRRRRRRRQWC